MLLEMIKDGLGVGYLVEDLVKDKETYEIITFNHELPAVDVCCVYVEDFLTTATKKFIEMISAFQK